MSVVSTKNTSKVYDIASSPSVNFGVHPPICGSEKTQLTRASDMDSRINRYARQTIMPEIGAEGQSRLSRARVFVAGCGALGGMAIELLARAGVGHIIACDRDVVEFTNLNRQVAFTESDAANARPKAEAIAERVRAINADVRLTGVAADLNVDNVEAVMLSQGPLDVIVDGLDNFETRRLLNDIAVKHGVPYIYGGAVSTFGAVAAILPKTSSGESSWEAAGRVTPCLQCLFSTDQHPGLSPTCDTAGVLGPLIAIVASLQATECLKVVLGRWGEVGRGVMVVDPWWGVNFARQDTAKQPAATCTCCAKRRFEHLEGSTGSVSAKLCGRDAVQISLRDVVTVDLDVLEARLRAVLPIRRTALCLHADVQEGQEAALKCTLFEDGRLIVRGTRSEERARQVFHRYFSG